MEPFEIADLIAAPRTATRGLDPSFRDVLERVEAAVGEVLFEGGDRQAASGVDYARLAAGARTVHDILARAGLGPGDVVAVFCSTSPELLKIILGVWSAGAAVTVLAPAVGDSRSGLSVERAAAMVRAVDAHAIFTGNEPSPALCDVAERASVPLFSLDDHQIDSGNLRLGRCDPEAAALVQFTSGSTSFPKPAVITHDQLQRNARLTAQRVDFGARDTFVSWLPLHHDFGFVVGFMMPVLCGARLCLIPTESFSRNPALWLQAVSNHRATFTATPPSAASLMLNPAVRRRLSEVDLSALKVMWLGSEPVGAALVDRFEEAYRFAGLKPGTLSAAYGLAEATLTVSVRSRSAERRVCWIDRVDFQSRTRITLLDRSDDGAMALLSNGPPLPGVRIRILDEAGNPAAEGVNGEIAIASSMMTSRYLGDARSPMGDGWFATGDLGFLLDDQLYVTGRSKDLIIKGGVNYFPHDIELALEGGLPEVSKAVCFAAPNPETLLDEVILGLEVRKQSESTDTLKIRAAELAINATGCLVDTVLLLPRGSIPRTTSGKVQRSRTAELFRAGELAIRKLAE